MPKKLNAEAATGFGPRLATLRKAAGITQTALAAEIQISQRMMAYYEGPTAHPPANLLPAMATALGVSVDTLLGIEASKRRAKASDTRLERRLRQIEQLNATDKRQVIQLIDAFIERGHLKRKQRQADAVSG
ncbi:MAG: helix-turn-helix transcriptional regulator [Gammaproteobacteria bacterium]|nr:helix-turn-helix transcriptional regulator [Gammaproteobacteria bacterium]